MSIMQHTQWRNAIETGLRRNVVANAGKHRAEKKEANHMKYAENILYIYRKIIKVYGKVHL